MNAMSDGEVFNSSDVSAEALASVALYIEHTGMSGWTGSAIHEELKRRAGQKRAADASDAALIEIGTAVLAYLNEDSERTAEGQARGIGLRALVEIRRRHQALGIEVVTIAPRPFGIEDLTSGYTISDIEAMRTKLGGDA
jgi:hypothetical protein